MVMDPISDFLIRIKNANKAQKTEVSMPYSKMKQSIATVLAKEGYIGEISKRGKKTIKDLVVELKYTEGKPVINGTQRVSKPSRRMYMSVAEIFPVKRGRGLL